LTDNQSEIEVPHQGNAKARAVRTSGGSFSYSLAQTNSLLASEMKKLLLAATAAILSVSGAVAAKVPSCDDSNAISLAKAAIERLSNDEKSKVQTKVQIFGLQNIHQKQYDAADNERTCTATALTNKGEQELTYTIEWIEPGKLYVVDRSLSPKE
jgi:hypothetical protein